MSFISYLKNLFDVDMKNLIYLKILVLDILLLYPSFALLKWNLLARLGTSKRERETIFSNRKNSFYLTYFIEKYGDRQLRI
ncbi:MAG: hypothetical protein MUD14_11655 [Hydrococcus sp. Prado102]|jgi:hypothetical protein|nr:hypothetical protein [Hydrococcus sp. Prado102]